jgi:hypothetical protein
MWERVADNCVECSKIGTTTECQYMEFPEGMHHYFDEKVCSFHHWFLYVRPKKSWENYLRFAQAEGAAAGYHITLPPDEVIKAAIRGDVPPSISPAGAAQATQAASEGQGQLPGSSEDKTAPQPPPSQT